MAVNIGDKVNYRGIKLEVVELSDGIVNLKREGQVSASITFSVTIGSNRYFAMFPNEEQNKERLTFDLTQPDITASVKHKDPEYGKFWKQEWGCFSYQEGSVVYEILNDYNENTEKFVDGKSALEDYKKKMDEDATGELYFYLHCYAYQNSAVKFDPHQVAKIADSQGTGGRKDSYTKSVLDYYLACLQDDNSATEIEIYHLIRTIPLKACADILLAFCGWQFRGRYRSMDNKVLSEKLIFSRKQAAELLRNLPTADDYEELV